jgi:cyclopropane fatty-acyl-phospholipid synthase-like methyltransferase
VIAVAVLCCWCTGRDPYGSFHVSLNRLATDDAGQPPRTEWLNLGYWQHTDIFPAACQALALKLAAAARCSPAGNVLDVGSATGESLILQLTSPSLPTPARLTGLTSLRTHYERATQRLLRIQSPVHLILAHHDAVYRPSASNHPLDPNSTSPPYSSILALDCAYHFNTRRDFLRQSFHRLAPGGSIALADITFTNTALANPPLRTRFLMWFLASAIPRANMITQHDYAQTLHDIGFVDVAIEDISASVFPGFCRFLSTRGIWWAFFGKILGCYHDIGLKFVIARASRQQLPK